MSMTFTKLFSSITASTIWAARDQTRILWITMLAMADQHGRVWASVPGLANIARISLQDCETALEELQAPDKYSRTKDHDGRRIEPIDGGWRLLNHAKYRAIRDEESIKESKRRYINARREKERAAVEDVEQSRTPVERGRANTEADTEAEAGKKTKTNAPKALVSLSQLTALGVEEADASSWLAARKAKRLPLTRAALAGVQAEADKAGMTLAQAIGRAAAEGWAGFKADWALTSAARPGGATFNKQEALEARNRAVGQRWLESMKGKAND